MAIVFMFSPPPPIPTYLAFDGSPDFAINEQGYSDGDDEQEKDYDGDGEDQRRDRRPMNHFPCRGE